MKNAKAQTIQIKTAQINGGERVSARERRATDRKKGMAKSQNKLRALIHTIPRSCVCVA